MSKLNSKASEFANQRTSFIRRRSIVVHTKPVIERLNFGWKIENFGSICPPTCPGFPPCRSQVFTVGEKVGKPSTWCFELRYNGGYLSLVLCHEKIRVDMSGSHREQELPCEVSVLSPDGTVALKGTLTPYPAKTRDDLMCHIQDMAQKIGATAQPREFSGWKKFISVRDLWDERRKFLGENETLHFKAVLDVTGVVEMQSFEERAAEKLNAIRERALREHQSNLLEDLEALRNNSDCSNLVLHCGSHIFSVHKQILQVRCPKFYLWLLEMAHSNSNIRICKSTDPILSKVVKIPDIDPEIMRAFLEYIYTGDVKGLPKVFSKWRLLLLIADRNDLKKLKDLCFFHMIAMLDVNTVAPLVYLSHKYGSPERVRDFIQAFCRVNYKVLINDDNFNQLREGNPAAFRFLDAFDPSMDS